MEWVSDDWRTGVEGEGAIVDAEDAQKKKKMMMMK